MPRVVLKIGRLTPVTSIASVIFLASAPARLRDELLNETLSGSLSHTREALAIWKDDYNTVSRTAEDRQYSM